MKSNQLTLRSIVRGAYDIQTLRVQMGNRICAQYKAKLGQQPSHTEEEDLDAESTSILAALRAEYTKLMDGVKKVRLAKFKATPLISSFTEFALLQQYLELEETEKQHFKNVAQILKEFPIWTEFLEGVKGCGPAMSGVLISEIDIEMARHPSSLWQFAGLGVEGDGRGTSKKTEHLHDIAYTDKAGNPAVRKGIRFNPFLKTKLMGVLAGSFIKIGMKLQKEDDPKGKKTAKGGIKQVAIKDADNKSIPIYNECSKYVQIYLDYKHRLQHHAAWTEATDKHIHNAALRKMIKAFLLDLYVAWRTLEGLEVSRPYHEAKLGHMHGVSHS